jgi:hypothetical protein
MFSFSLTPKLIPLSGLHWITLVGLHWITLVISNVTRVKLSLKYSLGVLGTGVVKQGSIICGDFFKQSNRKLTQ